MTLDLTGLPPTPAELDAFLADESPEAYERAVDRLLASPRYGERMALDWLDAARYADTNGYYTDLERQAWPWRDWVIRGLQPQHALRSVHRRAACRRPAAQATPEQQIATGFNRNHMVTNESGIIDEEYRVGYVVDRVDTTATVWLGLTLGCARCHDHKYDPISQREYYGLFAYFNNVARKRAGQGAAVNPPPVLALPTAAQERGWPSSPGVGSGARPSAEGARARLERGHGRWEKTAVARCPLCRRTASPHFDFDRGRRRSRPRAGGRATTSRHAEVRAPA